MIVNSYYYNDNIINLISVHQNEPWLWFYKGLGRLTILNYFQAFKKCAYLALYQTVPDLTLIETLVDP